ncbi:MAG TPA: hypothetical protein PKZ10_02140 [Candidatus Pacearchaeota archaeon]|nr:hypothetical protein [Thermodesulfovibrio thiophilus]HQD89272.1 hypothetical protein [Candidatus Pacearchaeota archaeon]
MEKYFRYRQKKGGGIVELTEEEAAKVHHNKSLEFLGDTKGGKEPPKGRQTEVIKGGKSTFYNHRFAGR